MTTKTNAEEIYSIVSSIIGLKVWEVKPGYGTTVFIEFGGLKTSFDDIEGERILWLENTWRLETSNEVLASSYGPDPDPEYLEALKLIDGRTLREVKILEPSLDTIFSFGDDLRIFVYNAYIEGGFDYAAWKFIYLEDKVLAVGPGPEFSIDSYSGK